MVKAIIGRKGSGKTKLLIDEINSTVKTAKGDVVCIEKNNALTFSLSHRVRLISASEYSVEGAEKLIGFVCGILAANYDVSDIFIDSILKILGKDQDKLVDVFETFSALSEKIGVNFTVTVSMDASELPEELNKYCA